MATLGLSPEDVAAEIVYVWPDTREPMRMFRLMDTQWRVGSSGATGLDYRVLFEIMDREHIDRAEQDELFAAVRIMEEAALKQMALNRRVAAEASNG